MARIVITSEGTLGDVLPLVALGRELRQRGHSVLMALNPRMLEHASRSGLECADNGRAELGEHEARRHAAAWNHLNDTGTPQSVDVEAVLMEVYERGLASLLELSRGADLLLATAQQYSCALLVAEALCLPLVKLSVTPSLHCVALSDDAQARAARRSEATDPLLQQIWVRARRSIGLPDEPATASLQPGHGEHLLLGSSPHFSRPAPDSAHAVQTGFWFHDDPRFADWQPTAELRAFMEQDPAPLVLSFSSQPLEDPGPIVREHVRAAALLGRPILIQQGWADFRLEHLPSDCDRSRIRFEGFLPQDWLFRQAAALIHHGGIGTTARALRNDCPMLVEPFGNDQFFNARQIVVHGLGAAMHPQRLQAEAVAEVLQRRVLTADTRARVAAMGAAIRAEDGLTAAASHLEALLAATPG